MGQSTSIDWVKVAAYSAAMLSFISMVGCVVSRLVPEDTAAVPAPPVAIKPALVAPQVVKAAPVAVAKPAPVAAPKPTPKAKPKPKVTRVLARVTACSPEDPLDLEYYSVHGYEGGTYGIAADPRQFPIGTLIKVPGYMEKKYPGQSWKVDSKGGSVIRRSANKGVVHIDVKFATTYSAKKWGNRWQWIEVQRPPR